MAIQSQLFRRLEDHATCTVIGLFISLALLQNIFFSLSYCQNQHRKKKLNLLNIRFFLGSKKTPL